MENIEFLGLTMWRDTEGEYWVEVQGGYNDGAMIFCAGGVSEETAKWIARKADNGMLPVTRSGTMYASLKEAEKARGVHINHIVIFRPAEFYFKRTAQNIVRTMVLLLSFYMVAIVGLAADPQTQMLAAWACGLGVLSWGYIAYRHHKYDEFKSRRKRRRKH